MKYTFKVTQTDTFETEIIIEAETESEAMDLLDKDIDECPIDLRSNTLQSSEIETELISCE